MQTPWHSHCVFNGAFTKDQKHTIHTSLRALDEAVGNPYEGEGPYWSVHRVPTNDTGEEKRYEVRVRNTELNVEMWGRSVDHLVDVIRNTTEVVRQGSSSGE